MLSLPYSSMLKMKTIYSSEMMGSLRTTRRYIPEDHDHHGHSRENPKCTNVQENL